MGPGSPELSPDGLTMVERLKTAVALPDAVRAEYEAADKAPKLHSSGARMGEIVNVQGVWYRVHAKRRRDLVLRRLTDPEIDTVRKMIRNRSQHAPQVPES